MAIAISVSSTVGGSCKTTVACLFAYALSASYRVLAIDLCGQRHLTEAFLNDHADSIGKGTICDVFEKGDVASNIVSITNNLHILPGDLWINSVPASLYIQGYSSTGTIVALRNLLNEAKANYDFVVIDTPGTSADELFKLSLSIADFAIMTYSPNKINLIENWLDKIRHVKDVFSPTLKVGGILRTRFNNIDALHKHNEKEVPKQYPEYCWNSTFPNSPLFANIDFDTIQKTQIVTAFKPIYNELILRLWSRNGQSKSQAR